MVRLAILHNAKKVVSDPSKTRPIRARYVRDLKRMITNLTKVVNKSIVQNDCFGLRLENAALTPIPSRMLAGLSDAEKIAAFNKWLEEQEEKQILETVSRGQFKDVPWQSKYIQSSYAKGIRSAQNALKSKGIRELVESADSDDIAQLLSGTVHSDNLQLAFTRSHLELKGITQEMNDQIAEQLAMGLAQGQNPVQIARLVADRVDKIGLTRATLLARTEIVDVHNRASVAEYDRAAAIIGEPVLSEWIATNDGRTRERHAERDGKIFESDEALQLLGEPNCRCAVAPYVESVDGEAETSQASTYIDPNLSKRRDESGTLQPA